MLKQYILPIIALVLFGLGCNRTQDIIPEHTYRLFPNEAGKFRIMYVEDTTFTTDGLDAPVVDRYFRRELLSDTTTDLRGRVLRTIETSRSEEEFGTEYRFQPGPVYAQYIEPVEGQTYFAERLANNQRVLVLQFPVFPGVTWNGNLFNNMDDQRFTYQSIDTTVIVRGKTYEQCVMVLREEREGIFNIFSYEIYAPDIGLIKKYDRRLIFNSGGSSAFNDSESRIRSEEIVEHN